MNPNSVPAQDREEIHTKVKWKELSYDERMKIIAQEIQSLNRVMKVMSKTVENLVTHKHDKNGFPMIEKTIQHDFVGYREPAPYQISNAFEHIDFEDDEG